MAIVSAGAIQAQTKMPIPVEDDPNSAVGKKSANPPAAPSASQSEITIVDDSSGSPYHQALIAYKAGNFQEAYDAIKGTDPTALDNTSLILESRILAELKRFDEAEKLLRPRLDTSHSVDIELALGDVLLRKHSFGRAVKYYAAAQQAKPNDPDIILKLVYAKIGAADFVGAGQDASHLAPLDPKNPYDDHASYYFARAALAQSAGKAQEAEDDIQAARTNYGITVTNRYLKTYLQVFAASDDKSPSDVTPPPRINPPSTGPK